ncbi:hypothetical protein L1887_56141 [Cichorium endivia]|nr:hypothetical protein L1887_56141 [Cichorium endivia]
MTALPSSLAARRKNRHAAEILADRWLRHRRGRHKIAGGEARVMMALTPHSWCSSCTGWRCSSAIHTHALFGGFPFRPVLASGAPPMYARMRATSHATRHRTAPEAELPATHACDAPPARTSLGQPSSHSHNMYSTTPSCDSRRARPSRSASSCLGPHARTTVAHYTRIPTRTYTHQIVTSIRCDIACASSRQDPCRPLATGTLKDSVTMPPRDCTARKAYVESLARRHASINANA